MSRPLDQLSSPMWPLLDRRVQAMTATSSMTSACSAGSRAQGVALGRSCRRLTIEERIEITRIHKQGSPVNQNARALRRSWPSVQARPHPWRRGPLVGRDLGGAADSLRPLAAPPNEVSSDAVDAAMGKAIGRLPSELARSVT
jgi:hypothetical protein